MNSTSHQNQLSSSTHKSGRYQWPDESQFRDAHPSSRVSPIPPIELMIKSSEKLKSVWVADSRDLTTRVPSVLAVAELIARLDTYFPDSFRARNHQKWTDMAINS
jgi:hypothetical protein